MRFTRIILLAPGPLFPGMRITHRSSRWTARNVSG